MVSVCLVAGNKTTGDVRVRSGAALMYPLGGGGGTKCVPLRLVGHHAAPASSAMRETHAPHVRFYQPNTQEIPNRWGMVPPREKPKRGTAPPPIVRIELVWAFCGLDNLGPKSAAVPVHESALSLLRHMPLLIWSRWSTPDRTPLGELVRRLPLPTLPQDFSPKTKPIGVTADDGTTSQLQLPRTLDCALTWPLDASSYTSDGERYMVRQAQWFSCCLYLPTGV